VCCVLCVVCCVLCVVCCVLCVVCCVLCVVCCVLCVVCCVLCVCDVSQAQGGMQKGRWFRRAHWIKDASACPLGGRLSSDRWEGVVEKCSWTELGVSPWNFRVVCGCSGQVGWGLVGWCVWLRALGKEDLQFVPNHLSVPCNGFGEGRGEALGGNPLEGLYWAGTSDLAASHCLGRQVFEEGLDVG
jgi:hypothetical protein